MKRIHFNFFNPIAILLMATLLVSCDKDETATTSKIFVMQSSLSDTTEIELYLGYQYVSFGGKNLTSDLIVKTSERIGISMNGAVFGHELSFPYYYVNKDTLILFAKFLTPEDESTSPSTMTFQSSGAESIIVELD